MKLQIITPKLEVEYLYYEGEEGDAFSDQDDQLEYPVWLMVKKKCNEI